MKIRLLQLFLCHPSHKFCIYLLFSIFSIFVYFNSFIICKYFLWRNIPTYLPTYLGIYCAFQLLQLIMEHIFCVFSNAFSDFLLDRFEFFVFFLPCIDISIGDSSWNLRPLNLTAFSRLPNIFTSAFLHCLNRIFLFSNTPCPAEM